MTECACPVEPQALICTICTKPIGIPGLDGIPVNYDGVEQWVHHGPCGHVHAERSWRPPIMTRERAQELLERARAAGRLWETDRS